MKISLAASLAATALNRWRSGYRNRDLKLAGGKLAGDIEDELSSLSPVTPKGVADIIGNTAWSFYRCDECGRSDLERVVTLGEEEDAKSYCVSCLRAASALASVELPK